MLNSKRGQGLSTSTIVLLILGVAVLVLLIVGFTMGWSNMKDRFLGSSTNTDIISQACATACSTNAKYDYCSAPREIKFKTDAEYKAINILKTQMVNCTYLASKNVLDNCSSITCA